MTTIKSFVLSYHHIDSRACTYVRAIDRGDDRRGEHPDAILVLDVLDRWGLGTDAEDRSNDANGKLRALTPFP